MPTFLPNRLLGLLGLCCLFAWTRPVQAQTFFLDLSSQRLWVPVRTMHVEQVVDGRGAQRNTSFGLVYRGAHGRPAAVLFERGMTTELGEWLQKQLPARPEDQPVVLCVRQLQVHEVVNGWSKQLKAGLALDVYAHLPDGYHFVRRFNDRNSQPSGDFTKTHAFNVAQLLQNALTLLANTQWQQAAQQPALTLPQLAADQPEAATPLAILRAPAPHWGIYRTPEQFFSNHPDTTVRLRIDTLRQAMPGWENTIRLQPVVHTAQGHRVAPRELWGFSNGRQAYIRHDNAFRPLIRQGNFYTFVSGTMLDVEVAQKRATNTMMYGVVGGALTSTAADRTGQPTVFALDMRTGQFNPFPFPGQPLPADTAYVYVYRPPGGPPEARHLFLNNKEIGSLHPGEFLEVPCAYRGRIMRFSLDQPNGPALLVVPDASSANYLKLITHPSGQWAWMPLRLGEADVDALEKRRKP